MHFLVSISNCRSRVFYICRVLGQAFFLIRLLQSPSGLHNYHLFGNEWGVFQHMYKLVNVFPRRADIKI